VVGVVLSAVVVGAIGGGLYVHDARSEAASNQRSHEHMQLEERLNEVVYVLTLSQQERERLNLAVPKACGASSVRWRTAHGELVDDWRSMLAGALLMAAVGVALIAGAFVLLGKAAVRAFR
jgi:hypothetical protein